MKNMFYTVTTASLHVTAHDSTVASNLACSRCRRRLHIGGVKGEGEGGGGGGIVSPREQAIKAHAHSSNKG